MTTIAALRIELNAQQARQEAQGIRTDLDGVSRSAKQVAVDIYGMGSQVISATQSAANAAEAAAEKTQRFQRSVGALGEVNQINQRVRLLGEEVRNLGSGFSSASTVASVFAQSLVDVAQISQRAQGGFGGLIGLLRANPLLAAAGVLSAIATAMSLFGGKTGETNEQLKEQIRLQQELKQASMDLALQIQRNADLQRIGFQIDQKEQETLRARRLAEVASGLAGQPGFQSFADLTALTGLTEAELRELAGRGGIATRTSTVQSRATGGRQVTREVELGGLTNEAAREIILRVAQIFRNQAVFSPNPTAPVQGIVQAVQPGQVTPGYPSAIGPMPGPEYMSPEQLAAYQRQFGPPTVLADVEKSKQAAEELLKLEERLQSLKTLGQDVGQAIGSAFFNIVSGAANARQALAALLQQFIAIAQQRAVQGIANAVGNAFAQSTANRISDLNTSTPYGGGQIGGGTSGGGLA